MNAAAQKQKRLLTVAEANQRLPLVRAIVDDIVTLFRDVHDRRQRLEKIRRLPGSAGRDENSLYGEELHEIERELEKDISRLEGFVGELDELGAELKDYTSGLVDFRTMMEGREVYLCWRLGEDEIGYWHELDAGVQGRQSLLEISLPGDEPSDEETT